MTDSEDEQEPKEDRRGVNRMRDDDQKWNDLDWEEEQFERDFYEQ